MLDKDKIGARRRAAKSRGFFQALLSERLNVSPQAVSKWKPASRSRISRRSWRCRGSTGCRSIPFLGNDMPVEAVAGDRTEISAFGAAPAMPAMPKRPEAVCPKRPPAFCCPNGHAYGIVDGVVDFGTREIPGEQWSLSYRNYDAYLQEHRLPRNPNYDRGEDNAEILWEALEKAAALPSGRRLRHGSGHQAAARQDLLADDDPYGGHQPSDFEMEQFVLYGRAAESVCVHRLSGLRRCRPAARDGTADCVFPTRGLESMRGQDGRRPARSAPRIARRRVQRLHEIGHRGP